jgi:hypothetical protein
MARIVVVHGAFNELWGPNELKTLNSIPRRSTVRAFGPARSSGG